MVTILTADHGTVERWYYPDGKIDTGHTDSLVPFIRVPSRPGPPIHLRQGGGLTDVAPTVLDLLGLPQPLDMTGSNLIVPAASMLKRPDQPARVLLLILDGWGIGDGGPGDLIAQAHTPVVDGLTAAWPHAQLQEPGRRWACPRHGWQFGGRPPGISCWAVCARRQGADRPSTSRRVVL